MGQNVTTPADTLTYQVYNSAGELQSTTTIPAPPDTYIQTSVESLAKAESQGLPYVPLPTSAAQMQQADTALRASIEQQQGATANSPSVSNEATLIPDIGCGLSTRVTGSYAAPASGATVNFAVNYNTEGGSCGINVTAYAANLNPGTSSSVYQCALSWAGNSTAPNAVIPNYYPNDDWFYDSTGVQWSGGGGYSFDSVAGLSGCGPFATETSGSIVLTN